jgi:hypothetical protein
VSAADDSELSASLQFRRRNTTVMLTHFYCCSCCCMSSLPSHSYLHTYASLLQPALWSFDVSLAALIHERELYNRHRTRLPRSVQSHLAAWRQSMRVCYLAPTFVKALCGRISIETWSTSVKLDSSGPSLLSRIQHQT